MSRFSPAFLDEIRARTTLSVLVGRTLKLQRAGREWKACCPFHHEKSPSFYVNDDKGFYHCFGCSAHGDAIRWMTDQRGVSFIDAVKELADATGLSLPTPDPQAAVRQEHAAGLHDVMAAAQTWFVAQLHGDIGAEASAYCSRRGLTPETVASFGIGFAPDRRDALRSALTHFGDTQLIEAGLLIAVEDKAPYDRFRGRLMIPIRDGRGRPIAFGGRILGAGEPKYLNSPETPLFDKGRTLYNVDKASAAARSTGRLIVVEGYLDVIGLSQVGIEDVVAPLGTALTESQLERLWRIVDVPLLCFDGDPAGRKAAVRAALRALPLLAPGRSLAVAMLPQGKDPDDVVREGGANAFEQIAQTARALVDTLWVHEFDALPLATPEARAGLKRRLLDHVAMIEDRDVRAQYREEIGRRFDEAFFSRRPQTTVRSQSRGRFPARWSPSPPSPGARLRNIASASVNEVYARAIFAGLVRHPSIVATCTEALTSLSLDNEGLRMLRNALIDHVMNAGAVDCATIDTISHLPGVGDVISDLRLANGLAFSFTRDDADPIVAQRDLAVAIEALSSRPELDAALEAATARQKDGPDADEFAEQMRLIAARAESDRVLAVLAQDDEEIRNGY